MKKTLPSKMFLLFILTLISIFGCQDDQINPAKQVFTVEEKLAPRIQKTVPDRFQILDDSQFKLQHDTLFFNDTLYSGFAYRLNEQGDTIELASFFNGVKEGVQKKYYTKLHPEEERFFINGRKEGRHRGWWPDGKMRFDFTCYNDEYEGEFREWAMSGMLIKCFHYQKGYETGSQRLWWSDGKVRANYVIRNGKRYGFLGYKICANPYDTIIKK
jgi:hypothetical protein